MGPLWSPFLLSAEATKAEHPLLRSRANLVQTTPVSHTAHTLTDLGPPQSEPLPNPESRGMALKSLVRPLG
jgi:hypothetical protein